MDGILELDLRLSWIHQRNASARSKSWTRQDLPSKLDMVKEGTKCAREPLSKEIKLKYCESCMLFGARPNPHLSSPSQDPFASRHLHSPFPRSRIDIDLILEGLKNHRIK